MKISPYYDAIKSRAIALLAAGAVNDHSMEEIAGWGEADRWVAHNTIGVALCMARDEIQDAQRDAMKGAWQDPDKPTIDELRVLRAAHFTKGNFAKAEAEIIRELCLGLRRGQAKPKPTLSPIEPG